MNNQVKDLTGVRFGKLVVVRLAYVKPRAGARWLCRCDCGEERTIDVGRLQQKKVTECHTCADRSQRQARSRWSRPFGGQTSVN